MSSGIIFFLCLCLVPMFLLAQVQDEVYVLKKLSHSHATITVGGANADIHGFDNQAIQTAIDVLRSKNGGVVKLTPGLFKITAPVRLFSHMSLIGSGDKTVLRKEKGLESRFVIDADYGELKVTVENPIGFLPGMGIQIFDEQQKGGWAVTTARITSVYDNVIHFDNYLVRDYRADHGGMVNNACSIISAVDAEDLSITDLVVEGNKSENKFLNGCRGGAVYLHKVKQAVIENVTVRNFNGDGISWQITEHVTVKGCDISGCTNSGLHPGTGSPFTIMQGNRSYENDRDGLFICWRVQHGQVRDNAFFRNGRFGLCTGHKDTDMLFTNNRIFDNGDDGVHFRGERESNAPHRNVFKENVIENNGRSGKGYGFSFNSPAKDVILENNLIQDTDQGTQEVAVYIYKNGLPVELKENTLKGHRQGDILFEEK